MGSVLSWFKYVCVCLCARVCVSVLALFLILSASIVPVELKVCFSLTHSGESSAYLFVFLKKRHSGLSWNGKKRKEKHRCTSLSNRTDADVSFGDEFECQTTGDTGDETSWWIWSHWNGENLHFKKKIFKKKIGQGRVWDPLRDFPPDHFAFFFLSGPLVTAHCIRPEKPCRVFYLMRWFRAVPFYFSLKGNSDFTVAAKIQTPNKQQ